MSESRRERFIRLLKSKSDLDIVEITHDAARELIEVLEQSEDIPAVDAVEVVRCRECKYYDMIDRDDVVKACLYWKSFMSKDGYCSIGERRENGDNNGAKMDVES